LIIVETHFILPYGVFLTEDNEDRLIKATDGILMSNDHVQSLYLGLR